MIDRELQQNVQNALDWEPSIESSEIGVSVANGIVTLRGDVHSYAEKSAAERVVLRMYGVKAVANDINVRLASRHERTDTEIAQAAVSALKWNTMVPPDKVHPADSDLLVVAARPTGAWPGRPAVKLFPPVRRWGISCEVIGNLPQGLRAPSRAKPGGRTLRRRPCRPRWHASGLPGLRAGAGGITHDDSAPVSVAVESCRSPPPRSQGARLPGAPSPAAASLHAPGTQSATPLRDESVVTALCALRVAYAWLECRQPCRAWGVANPTFMGTAGSSPHTHCRRR